MKICEMISSENGEFFIGAAEKKFVNVYAPAERAILSRGVTNFKSGGKRAAVANNRRYFAAAAESRYGVTLYDTASESKIWNNKDIKKIQRIDFSADSSLIYVVCCDKKKHKMYTLSVKDGTVTDETNGISKIVVSHFGNLLLNDENEIICGNTTHRSNIEVSELCRFENGFGYVSDGLHVCDLDGNILWENDKVYQQLAYFEDLKLVGGLYSGEGKHYVDVYDVTTGNFKYTYTLDYGNVFVFLGNTGKIVSSSGRIYLLGENGGEYYSFGMFKIYDMKVSENSKYLLASESEKNIQVWDCENNKMLLNVSTIYSFGGKRMDISNSGEFLAAASYNSYGISLYSVETGEEIWNTRNVGHPQIVRFSYDSKVLYVVNNDEMLYTLSLKDGSIIEKKSNTANISVSEFGEISATSNWPEKNKVICGSAEVVCEKLIHDLLRLKDSFVYSLVGQGIFCCDLNGNLLWKTENSLGKFGYCEKYNYLYALRDVYNEVTFERYSEIHVFDKDSGKLIYTQKVDDGLTFAFVDGGERIVSSTGFVYVVGENELEKVSYEYEF